MIHDSATIQSIIALNSTISRILKHHTQPYIKPPNPAMHYHSSEQRITSSNMKTTLLVLSLLLTSLLFSHTSNAAVTCGNVATKALSCVAFATGKQPKPTPVCCNNLKMLVISVKTVNDKRAICRCLKEGVNAFPGVKDKYLSQIPRLCGIRIPFPVSLNTNCNR